MGIRDFFRRNKGRKNVYNNNSYNKTYDFDLNYSSGINAQVSYGDLENIILDSGSSKWLQKVFVMYLNKKRDGFEGLHLYMDPVFDEMGNNITKEAYMSLLQNNLPLLKGFFHYDQVKSNPTNYIGHIAYNDRGEPYRGKDSFFEKAYRDFLAKIADRKRNEANKQFNKELQSQINTVPQNYDCKNEQPQDLSKVECPYKDDRWV